MVPIKCIFLLLNATTFRGISGQTHGISNKTQWIQCIILKDQFDVFLGKKMYFLDQDKKAFVVCIF